MEKWATPLKEIAVSRGHEIVLRVSTKNMEDNTISNIQKADVAIEFSRPDIAFNNLHAMPGRGCARCMWHNGMA
jgi:4-hydroxy-tetrahydrodipicolinate reductase